MPEQRDISALYRDHAGTVVRWAGRLGDRARYRDGRTCSSPRTGFAGLSAARPRSPPGYSASPEPGAPQAAQGTLAAALPGSTDNLLERLVAKGPTPVEGFSAVRRRRRVPAPTA